LDKPDQARKGKPVLTGILVSGRTVGIIAAAGGATAPPSAVGIVRPGVATSVVVGLAASVADVPSCGRIVTAGFGATVSEVVGIAGAKGALTAAVAVNFVGAPVRVIAVVVIVVGVGVGATEVAQVLVTLVLGRLGGLSKKKVMKNDPPPSESAFH
jgi:hypothetical protein